MTTAPGGPQQVEPVNRQPLAVIHCKGKYANEHMKHQQQQQQQQHLDKVRNPRDHGIASATCGHCAADELRGQALPAVAVGIRIRHCSCGIVAAANLGGRDAYFVAPATRCSAGESLWGLRGATV